MVYLYNYNTPYFEVITMHNKLDMSLFRLIKTQSVDNDKISVIVYVKDIDKALKFFDNAKYKVKAIYRFINAICVEIDISDLRGLVKSNYINFISSQAKVFAQVNVAKRIIRLQDFYADNILGQGINVVVIDTGVAPHTDFLFPSKRIIYFKDFVNKKENFYDDNGHGTFIAGLIGSNGVLSGKKYSGIAPLCKLIILKALDKDGQSSSVEMLEAMQWVFDNKDAFNIDIVCMSFGALPTSRLDPLMKGAEKLWDKGIVVVAAAGNSGPDRATIKSPGASRKIITVGSMDDSRNENGEFDVKKFKIADFSSRGPAFEFYKPDMVVSGVNLTSCGISSIYTTMSGTSVSAPIVAGISALILQKYNKKISPNQVKTLLEHYCHPIARDRNVEGFGYLAFEKIIK